MKKALAFAAAILFAGACGPSAATSATATRAAAAGSAQTTTAASGTPQHSMSPSEMAAMTQSARPAATTAAIPAAQPAPSSAPIGSGAPAATAIATNAPIQATAAPTTAPADNTGPATTVSVMLTDSAIRVSTPTAPSGKVTFLITNGGAVEHEFVVLQTSLPQNAIPVDPKNAALVQEPGLLGKTPSLAPKTSTTLSLSLPAGSYVLICNELAHYMALGMHTSFSVR